MNDDEILREGLKALLERFGVSGSMRFLVQFAGQGDYVRERRGLFEGVTLEELVRRIDAEGAGDAGEQSK